MGIQIFRYYSINIAKKQIVKDKVILSKYLNLNNVTTRFKFRIFKDSQKFKLFLLENCINVTTCLININISQST